MRIYIYNIYIYIYYTGKLPWHTCITHRAKGMPVHSQAKFFGSTQKIARSFGAHLVLGQQVDNAPKRTRAMISATVPSAARTSVKR